MSEDKGAAFVDIVYRDVRGHAGDWSHAAAGEVFLDIAYELDRLGIEMNTIRDILKRLYHAVEVECGVIDDDLIE